VPEKLDFMKMSQVPGIVGEVRREWFAVSTMYQHEHSVLRHLQMRGIESFVPSYEIVRVWKNRQKKTLLVPLFSCYVFARVHRAQRGQVLSSPGAVRIAGSGVGPIAIPDVDIEFLRGAHRLRIEQFAELAVGERVRIIRGPMVGIEGTLVRRQNDRPRFVLHVNAISQSVAIEIDEVDLEYVVQEGRACQHGVLNFA
jgi:transcription antitermination factor NusG